MMSTILDPIKMRFYIEKYDRENRNIKLFEKFTPSSKQKPITEKFYSKYKTLKLIDVIPSEYIRIIDRYERMLPRQIYSYKPPTTNMNYGWFTEPLVPRSTDPRLYFPLNYTDIVKTEMKIRNIDKDIRRKEFRGIPFKTN